MAAKIFVGNLDFKSTRDQVQALFAEVGEVRDVFLPTDRETGRPRGFAFVEYVADADAAKAIEKFNGYQFGGRALRVNAAEERQRSSRPPSMRPPSGSGDSRGGGGYSNDFGGDFGNDIGRDESFGRTKGSRRNIRAKKRSL